MRKFLTKAPLAHANEEMASSSVIIPDLDEDNAVQSSQNRKKNTSSVWNYFKASNDKKLATCLTCGKVCKTSGNTSNLRDHIQRQHKNINPNSDSSENVNTIATPIKTFLEKTIEYDNKLERKKKCDDALIWLIATDLQPLNIVDNEGFQNFVNVLDPRYKLPCKTTLRNKLLGNKFAEAKEKLQVLLNRAKHFGVTADLWTSKAKESYMTVTCSFIDPTSWILHSATLSTKKLLDVENHSAANIANSLKLVLEDWKIFDRTSIFTTDSASSMIKACDLLGIKHLPCFAHVLNLVVQDGLKNEDLKPLIVKCKEIASYFKKSVISYEKFKVAQNVDTPLGLFQEVPTRWNSLLQMIKRILETNEAISKVLLSTPKSPNPLSAEEIEILKEYTSLLLPFQQATEQASGSSYVSVSLIIPLSLGLKKKISSIAKNLKTAEGCLLGQSLMQSLNQRLSEYVKLQVTGIATILDPRFKEDGFESKRNVKLALSLIDAEMIQLSHSDDEDSFQSQESDTNNNSLLGFLNERKSKKFKSKLTDKDNFHENYLRLANMDEKACPLEFWKVNANQFPKVKDIVLKYFCVPASSAESERNFSRAGLIISDRRTRLKEKNVDMIMFLGKNKWVLES